ncbi:MAG TPA: DUF1918 domain-containing protein [Gaiellaceae bacterium]|jgi:rRNA processing protein Gar1|nr:DUF1918 domain-containing protein [Gaiellaceae bacterium]
MNETHNRFRAGVGDVVAIHGHHVGEPERLGEILEVLGQPDHTHFRVRWDDDHESIFYPGNDASVRIQRRKREVKKP